MLGLLPQPQQKVVHDECGEIVSHDHTCHITLVRCCQGTMPYINDDDDNDDAVVTVADDDNKNYENDDDNDDDSIY